MVAERSVQPVDGNSAVVLQMGGYARSRYGQLIAQHGDEQKARTHLRQADGMLQRALPVTGSRAKDLDRSCRGCVLNGLARERLEGEDVKPSIEERSHEWLRPPPTDARARENADKRATRYLSLNSEQ